MNARRLQLTVVLLSGPLATPAWAQSEPAHPCAVVASARDRLACYDAAFPPRAESAQIAAPDAAPAATFGFTDAQTRERVEKQSDAASQPDSISMAVREVRRRSTGEFIATLENAQVWVQTETNSRARVEPGDTVTIRKAALGSYLLVTEGGIGTRVRRAQ